MSFTSYLLSQRGRPDPVGDLASDATGDKHWPRDNDSYRECHSRLTRAGACKEAFDALREAYEEYTGTSVSEDSWETT